jgi:Fe-S-cluster containining protein
MPSSALLLPASDERVLAALEAAYGRFDARSAAWLEKYQRGGGYVHCGKGCAACCNFPVQVSLAEGLLVAQSLEPDQLEAMRAHAFKVMRNARGATEWNAYLRSHRVHVGFCPLLNRETGACTAYAVRPTRCRDTYSTLDAHYCTAGVVETLGREERAWYARTVRENPVTDGVSHYIAPLEDLSADVATAVSVAMRAAWGVELWGDFWVLTSLAADEAFMNAVRAGHVARAVKRAKSLGLWHPEIVRFE